jgi:hypothetical protein
MSGRGYSVEGSWRTGLRNDAWKRLRWGTRTPLRINRQCNAISVTVPMTPVDGDKITWGTRNARQTLFLDGNPAPGAKTIFGVPYKHQEPPKSNRKPSLPSAPLPFRRSSSPPTAMSAASSSPPPPESTGAESNPQPTTTEASTPERQPSPVSPPSHEPSLICLWVDCGKSYPDPELLYNHLCNDHIGRKSTNNLCLTCKWKECGATCAKRDHITSHLRGNYFYAVYV